MTSVTCDGTSHNLSALELLGASLSIYDDRPYFSHPSDPARRVCVFLDVPHMIKLIRNSFESLGVIVWKGKGKVSWQFINDLLKVQNEHGLSLANKLTERHINFHGQKMKVSLATQVFSKSVADSLRFLHSQYVPGFCDSNVLVTADFLEFFNNLFDIFNSRRLYAYGFSRPLKMATKSEWELFLKRAQSTLLDLEDVRGAKLICSKKKTGFLGFFCDKTSILHLSEDLFMTGAFDFLLTYKLCQDFLELFFNAIRIRNGWNVNPTPTQFRNAFRQLLLHAGPEILQSVSANVNNLDKTMQLSLQFLSADERVEQFNEFKESSRLATF